MIDESALASGIYQNLSKCLALRNKYYELSLQASQDTSDDDACSLEVNNHNIYIEFVADIDIL